MHGLYRSQLSLGFYAFMILARALYPSVADEHRFIKSLYAQYIVLFLFIFQRNGKGKRPVCGVEDFLLVRVSHEDMATIILIKHTALELSNRT